MVYSTELETASGEKDNSVEKWAPSLTKVINHEHGHAYMTKYLGGDCFYEFNLETNEGAVHQLGKLDKHSRALVVVSGFAAEVIEEGVNNLVNSGRGSKGLSSDSRDLDNLGYTSQEQKAKLLEEAIDILNCNWGSFTKSRKRLTHIINQKKDGKFGQYS